MIKIYLFIALAALTLILFASTSCGNQPAESDDSQPKAAIIDQLYLLQPNQAFTVVASQNGPDLNLSATFGNQIVTDSGGVLAFHVDASRTVTALYSSPIFSDGFESGGVGEWSSSTAIFDID